MPTRLQARAFVFLLLMLGVAGRSARGQEKVSPQDALRAECNAMLLSIVHKPYGSALPTTRPVEVKQVPRNSSYVSFSPQSTPTVGLMLHYAGKALDEPQYTQAARKLAQGIMAAQDPTGRVPEYALFSTSVSGRQRDSAVPDRGPTVASLAFLLTLIDKDSTEDEPLRRCATRCANWLTQEQTPKGYWPATIPDPNPKKPAVRILRLDSPDYRDCTLALFYAGEVLRDARYTLAAKKAVDALIAGSTQRGLRPDKARTPNHLWRPAYDFNAQPHMLYARTGSLDVLASRYATELLLYDVLMRDQGEEKHVRNAVTEAATTFKLLMFDDGTWDRFYPLTRNEARRRGALPPKEEESPFGNPNPSQATESFGVPSVLAAIERMNVGGLGGEGKATLRRRMTLVLCGSGEELFLSAPYPLEARLDDLKIRKRPPRGDGGATSGQRLSRACSGACRIIEN